MDDKQFKTTLIKAIEREAESSDESMSKDLKIISSTLPICDLYLNETDSFTYEQWNTYITILYIQVPVEKLDIFETYRANIKNIAAKYMVNMEIIS